MIITYVKLVASSIWEIVPQKLVEPQGKLPQALRATFAQYGVTSFIFVSIDAVFVPMRFIVIIIILLPMMNN